MRKKIEKVETVSPRTRSGLAILDKAERLRTNEGSRWK